MNRTNDEPKDTDERAGPKGPGVSVERELKKRDAGAGLQRGPAYRGEVDDKQTEKVDEKSPRRT